MSFEHPDSFDNIKTFPTNYIECLEYFTYIGKTPDISHGDPPTSDRVIFWLRDTPLENFHVMVFNEEQWEKLKKTHIEIEQCFEVLTASLPKRISAWRRLSSTLRKT